MTANNRQGPLLRSVSVMLLMVSAVASVLTGCSLLGDSGIGQPMSMTLRDGEYVFRWCGEQTDEFRYLEVGYAEYTPERVDATVFEGSGSATLSPGDEFSVVAPPEGISATNLGSFPDSNNSLLVFFYTGYSESVHREPSAMFDVPNPKDLEGKWVYAYGGTHDEPCEMRGAVKG